MNDREAQNIENSAVNWLFPPYEKLMSHYDMSHRIESLEALVRVLLDRMSAVDSKRVIHEPVPSGYRLKLITTELELPS